MHIIAVYGMMQSMNIFDTEISTKVCLAKNLGPSLPTVKMSSSAVRDGVAPV